MTSVHWCSGLVNKPDKQGYTRRTMYSEACVLEHALGHSSPNGMSWDSEQRFWHRAEVHDLEIKSSDSFDFIFNSGKSSQRPSPLPEQPLPQSTKPAQLLLLETSVC